MRPAPLAPKACTRGSEELPLLILQTFPKSSCFLARLRTLASSCLLGGTYSTPKNYRKNVSKNPPKLQDALRQPLEDCLGQPGLLLWRDGARVGVTAKEAVGPADGVDEEPKSLGAKKAVACAGHVAAKRTFRPNRPPFWSPCIVARIPTP